MSMHDTIMGLGAPPAIRGGCEVDVELCIEILVSFLNRLFPYPISPGSWEECMA